jgi:hypothetical protein
LPFVEQGEDCKNALKKKGKRKACNAAYIIGEELGKSRNSSANLEGVSRK